MLLGRPRLYMSWQRAVFPNCRSVILRSIGHTEIKKNQNYIAGNLRAHSDCMEQVRFESPKRCPACGQQCLRDKVFKRHIERCCPDHLPKKYQNKNGLNLLFENEKELEAWLAEARERETLLYKEAVRYILILFCRCTVFLLYVSLWEMGEAKLKKDVVLI